jgi:hypothetical protein
MIVEQFDRRTMAKMEAALGRVCERFPHGGKHNIRERAAQGIVRCAKRGNTDLEALIEAGERALEHSPNMLRRSARRGSVRLVQGGR